MSADHELKYKITTEGDASGANTVAAGLQKVDQAAQSTAKSASDTAKNLNQTGEVAEKLRGGATVVQEVLSGNLRALSQFPAVLKGIGAAAAANPLLAIGTVLGLVIIPALQKLKQGWEEAGKAAEEAGKKNVEALTAARQAIAEKQGNRLVEELRAIGAEADDARRRIELLTQAAIEQNDFEEAQALAVFSETAKKKGFSENQTTIGRGEIRRQFKDRNETLALQGIDQGEATAQRELERKREKLVYFKEAEARAQASLDSLEARSPAVVEKELKQAKRDASAISMAMLDQENLPLESRQELNEAFSKAQSAVNALADEFADITRSYADDEKARSQILKDTAARRAQAEEEVTEAFLNSVRTSEEAPFKRGSLKTRRATADVGEGAELGTARAAAGKGAASTADQAAQEAMNKISGVAPIDTKESAGGIIQIANTFVAVQGLNRQEFKRLDDAVKASSEAFRRELEIMRSKIENLQNAGQ